MRVKNFKESLDKYAINNGEVLRLDLHKGSLISKNKFFESFGKTLNSSENKNGENDFREKEADSPMSEPTLKNHINLHLRLKKQDLQQFKTIQGQVISGALLRELFDSFCNSSLKVVELSEMWKNMIQVIRSEQLNSVMNKVNYETDLKQGLIQQIVEIISILAGPQISAEFIDLKIRKWLLFLL